MRNHKQTLGASLIEVLVVTVIISIGLLGILRIFPRGFTGLAHSANVTTASRLADLQSEWWKSNATSLPDAIVCRYSDASAGVDGTVLVDAAMRPNDYDTTDQNPLPAPVVGPVPAVPRSMFALRDIIGEVVRVKPGPLVDSVEVAIAQVAFAPIETPAVNSFDNTDSYDSVVYAGRRTKLADNRQAAYAAYAANPSSIPEGFYVLDNNSRILTFNPVAEDRFFRIDYSYRVGSDVFDVVGEVFCVPKDKWTPVTVDANGEPTTADYHMGGSGSVVPDSEVIHRAFQRVGTIDDIINSYQYVVDPGTGIFTFHKSATDWQVSIDYRVSDWRNLREERVVPEIDATNADVCSEVRLALPHTRKVGDEMDDAGTIYRGLTGTYDPNEPSNTPGGTGLSVMVIDRVTGGMYNEGTDFADDDTDFIVDYRRGVLRFRADLTNRRVGIYYQAEGDWAVQTIKAAVSYNSAQESGLAWYRKYQYSTTSDTPMYLYFQPSEEGKIVSIDYTYKLDCPPSDPAYGRVYTKIGEMATIHIPFNTPDGYLDKQPLVTLSDVNSDDKINYTETEIPKDYVQVPNPDPNPPAGEEYLGRAIDWNSVTILAVRGVSLKTRVYWTEGGKWYHQELDTILNRQDG